VYEILAEYWIGVRPPSQEAPSFMPKVVNTGTDYDDFWRQLLFESVIWLEKVYFQDNSSEKGTESLISNPSHLNCEGIFLVIRNQW
jgi:hypothetical protein